MPSSSATVRSLGISETPPQLDLFGRSTLHTLELVEQLELDALGIKFRSYMQGVLDTTSPTGRLVLTVLMPEANLGRSIVARMTISVLSPPSPGNN